MAFHIHPDPQAAPLRVDPGATVYTPITQLTGTDPTGAYSAMMFIRVSMFGGISPPTLYLKAGSGAAVEAGPNTTAVYGGPPPQDYVGDVQLFPEAHNVHRIRMGFVGTGTEQWQLGIRNNDPATGREFTWVVADLEGETAQPWTDVSPPEAVYRALVKETLPQSVQVSNKGTGVLNVTALSPALPAGFTVAGALPLVVQPSTTVPLTLNFTAPDQPPSPDGTSVAAVDLVASPPDTTATSSAGHNARVSLVATTQRIEVVLLLDDSGSMTDDPKGDEPANPALSRWGELVAAAGQFLDLLAHFAEGRGRFGIARFPAGGQDSSTYDVVPMADIPGVAGMAAAKAAIAAVQPLNSTPMGDGLDHVLAPGTGYFSSDGLSVRTDRRWLVLMSDGAQNSGTHLPLECVAPPVGTAPVGSSLAERNIALFAVAYGLDGYSDVDHVLMKQLATGSLGGGQVRCVDDEGSTATTLAAALRDVLKTGLTPAASPRDPDSVLQPGASADRHEALFTRYDDRIAVVLSWNEPGAERLRLELLTPCQERITPESAGQDPFADVLFRGDERSQMYLIDRGFLNGAGGRQGTWTLAVSPGSALQGAGETYRCDVLVDSSLTLSLRQDREVYFAGDPITVSAVLTAEGRRVIGAAVSLDIRCPGRSLANWLAALDLPADAVTRAQEQLAGNDASPLMVKQVAAKLAGLAFDPDHQSLTVAMTDPDGTGVYRATLTDTTVPEHYVFYATATGTTGDGVAFRREARQETYVLVRPSAEYSRIDVHQTEQGAAKVTLIPRDAFGNVLLVDPLTAGGFDLQVSGGTVNDLVSHLDGTYSFDLTFDPATTPHVGFSYLDEKVVLPSDLVFPHDLDYPDRVVSYEPGVSQEANKFADPESALGTVVGRTEDRHVALGAGGRLAVGFGGRAVVGGQGRDVTVFVRPGTERRPYRLEAYAVDRGAWVTVGESTGITQSFPLGMGAVKATPALRITDTSGRTRDSALRPLDSPGVGVLGVGVRRTTSDLPWPDHMMPDWLPR